MTHKQREELMEDFKQWSGGFPPESRDQITVYVEHAMPGRIDTVEATGALEQWMNSQNWFPAASSRAGKILRDLD